MRFVSPRVHGVLDYLFGAIFLLAPAVLDFATRTGRVTAFVVGGAILILSLLTRYPLGVLRVIPFPVHGGVEFVASLALIAMPWLGRFQDFPVARNFYVGTGVVLFGLWLVTDYKAAELGEPRTFHRPAVSR